MIRRCLMALALAAGIASESVLADLDEATIEAIRALWQNQHKMLDAHDVDGVLATYADSEDIMLMGTGPGEHWVGKAEIKDAYAHFMENFDAHTKAVKCGEGHGSTANDVVWFTAVCDFTDQQKGEERQFTTNLSGVVIKQKDAWRFHTIHFSHLTGK